MDWSNWKFEWCSTRRLKHATVRGKPVAGTGKRRKGRHACKGCSWCKPMLGTTRTAIERNADKFEQEAND